MTLKAVQCSHCGAVKQKPASAINRSAKSRAPMYCNRVCAGEARRKEPVPDDERRRLKAEYDAVRRVILADKIRAEKRARHLATYDPAKAREARKQRMPAHVEYCRQPAYREKKKTYDRKRRCQIEYGDFWEAASVLFDVENEVRSRASDYEIRVQNGTLNKALNRRRQDANAQR